MLGPIHPIFRAERVEALSLSSASLRANTDKRGPVAAQEAPAPHSQNPDRDVEERLS